MITREKENELLLIATRWEAICDLLDGEEVSEFALSFPEVQKVDDLLTEMKYLKEHCQNLYRILE